MRLLPSVIKASQYGGVKNADAFPLKIDDSKHVHKDEDLAALDLEGTKRQILEDAVEKARQIVLAAQSYSEDQIREATQRIKEEGTQIKITSREEGYKQGLADGKEEGKAAGYQAGFAEGQKKAEEQNRALADELRLMLHTVEQQKDQVLQSLSQDVQGLAFAIAEKVVKVELRTDAAAMQAIIKSATDAYRNQSWVRISVSPQTADILAKADNDILQALQEVSDHVKITASPEMKEGDCKIDMPDQMIDASADAQLEKIKNALHL